MPKAATINPNNLFYLARISASAENPELANRVEAARLAHIPKRRLELIEHGAVDPTPEELWMLTRAYRMPSLPQWYCENACRYCGENKGPRERFTLHGPMPKLLQTSLACSYSHC